MRHTTLVSGAAVTAVLAMSGSASASVLVGEPTMAGPISTQCVPACIVGNASAPAGGGLEAAPFSGVLVHWRVRARSSTMTAKQVTLRTLTRNGGMVTLRGTGPTLTTTADNNFTVLESAARLPIAKADLIAVDGTAGWAVGGRNSEVAGAASYVVVAEPRPDGATVATLPASPGSWMNINADLESDVDGDGYGDETQDSCPTDKSTQGTCPVIAPSTPVQVPVAVPVTVQPRPTLAGAKTTLAKDGKSISVSFTCPATRTSACGGAVGAQTSGQVTVPKTKRRAQLVLGSAGYSAQPGRTATAKIKLNGTARALFSPGRSVKVSLSLRPADGPVSSATKTLKRAKAKKKKR